MSIDFGSEVLKIAVETDFPDPMVLNMQGGRTTPNVLALQDDEIFFGDIAVSLQQRVNTSYIHTKQLLGRRADEVGPKDTGPSGGPPWFHAMFACPLTCCSSADGIERREIATAAAAPVKWPRWPQWPRGNRCGNHCCS